jgi:beta-xylosidase
VKKIISLFTVIVMLIVTIVACDSKTQVPVTEEVPEKPGFTINDLDTSPIEEISYYQNPILTANTEDAWTEYGFGDPFVMRHNGVYYLYVSTKNFHRGIKCWSSEDLVNWKYEKFCANDRITIGAFAPEVFYYNGYFYMYTSPEGKGHYVLRSKSPTGPFEPITDNLKMSFDGSVFIDNDGKWYFYTAGTGAIRYYNMTSPSQMNYGGTLENVSVNGGWTEGSMIVYVQVHLYL